MLTMALVITLTSGVRFGSGPKLRAQYLCCYSFLVQDKLRRQESLRTISLSILI